MTPKIGGSMRWLIVFVAMFLGAGAGAAHFAWAEEELDMPSMAGSGLSESPSASADSDEARTAGLLAVVVPEREPAEEIERALQAQPGEVTEYDPWEPFNERMFTVNRQLDHYVLKPVATGYDKVVPNEMQRGLGRMFENVFAPRRFVNCLLQGKAEGAGRELLRFV